VEYSVRNILERIDTTDPRLLTPQMLARFEEQAKSILTHLRAFLDDRSEGKYQGVHIVSAEEQVDELLNRANLLPALQWSEASDVVARAARRFRDLGSAQTRSIRATVSPLRNQAAQI